jgi:hypothetical protein
MSREIAREHVALLRLGTFRKLDTTQLEGFVFDDSSVRPHSREVLTRRILQGLRTRGLIARAPRLVGGPAGGSARSVYYLTDAGHRLLGRLDPGYRRPKPAPLDGILIEHSLMVADVMLSFRRSARQHPGHELRQWENDWQVAARLGSSKLVPDACLAYSTGAWEVEAFVEVDLGTEHPARFADKIRRYVALFRSGLWQRELQRWPLVLTVTPSGSRTTTLRAITERVLEPERDLPPVVEFDFATLADLEGPGPLGEIWQLAGQSGLHPLIREGTPGEDIA